MKKRFFYITLLFSILVGGCSSIMNTTTQEIEIISTPPKAKLTIDGRPFGTTPQVVNIERGKNHSLKLELQGHETYEIQVTTKVSSWVWANVLNGFIPGFLIDYFTGSMYNLLPNNLDIPLTLLPEPKAPVKK